jgi:hypothetical protein
LRSGSPLSALSGWKIDRIRRFRSFTTDGRPRDGGGGAAIQAPPKLLARRLCDFGAEVTFDPPNLNGGGPAAMDIDPTDGGDLEDDRPLIQTRSKVSSTPPTHVKSTCLKLGWSALPSPFPPRPRSWLFQVGSGAAYSTDRPLGRWQVIDRESGPVNRSVGLVPIGPRAAAPDVAALRARKRRHLMKTHQKSGDRHPADWNSDWQWSPALRKAADTAAALGRRSKRKFAAV